jgi:hypothetical protein
LGGTIPSSLCSVTPVQFGILIDCDNIACSCCTSTNNENGTETNCTVA